VMEELIASSGIVNFIYILQNMQKM